MLRFEGSPSPLRLTSLLESLRLTSLLESLRLTSLLQSFILTAQPDSNCGPLWLLHLGGLGAFVWDPVIGLWLVFVLGGGVGMVGRKSVGFAKEMVPASCL